MEHSKGGERGRDALLKRLVDHVHENGLPVDRSLRQLAAAVGTTHRMLRYHFGSREGVLSAILIALRAEDQVTMRSTAAAWGRRDAILAMWSHFSNPGSTNRLSAFFRIVGEALHDRPAYREFLDSLESWTAVITELGIDEGLDPEQAEEDAHAVIAVIRGLGLQLLVTQNKNAVQRAFDRSLEALLPQPRSLSPRRRS